MLYGGVRLILKGVNMRQESSFDHGAGFNTLEGEYQDFCKPKGLNPASPQALDAWSVHLKTRGLSKMGIIDICISNAAFKANKKVTLTAGCIRATFFATAPEI